MRPYWLLLLAGCGSPFSAGLVTGEDAGYQEAMPEGDSGMPPAPDADTPEATPDVKDSGNDSNIEAMPDAPAAGESGPDVSDTGPVDSGCTPYPPTSWFCGGAPMAVPSLYCVSFMYSGGAQVATPPECQCAGTYTCACILAHSADPCSGAGTFKSCSGTTVYCS